MPVSPPARPGVIDVLVVDDDAAIRAVIRDILQAEGFTVAVATDGAAALAELAQRRPAVILLDLHMPVMDGWALHRRLRVERQPIPVVFMTAGARARLEAEQHGADGYLAKPFELDALLAVVERYTTLGPA